MERHENTMLKQDNDRLRMENITMKESLRNPVCSHCGGPAVLGETTIEEHRLRLENGRLRDELTRLNSLTSKFLGRPLSSVSSPIGLGNSDLELAVGRNGFGGVSAVSPTMPLGLDFVSGIPGALSGVPPTRSSLGTGFDVTTDTSMYVELAMAAMEEFLKLAQVDNLWFRGMEGGGESLNLEEYTRSFPPCIGMKPESYVSEATRASGTVIINSTTLVEMMMDANRWTEMFSCMLGKASVVEVISFGLGGSKNGALQVMQAEFQILTPLVAVRPVKFLRFCKQHTEGYWAVVDVSVDSIRDGSTGQIYTDCRRLPSGCIVQDLPNGYSKVIWIEHMEYDETTVNQSFRPLLRSGLGLGAQKWVATLERQCEFLAVILSSTVQGGDQAVISPAGRKSLAKLAQRMTRNFGTGICATVHNWDIVQVGDANDPRLMMRKSYGNPGEPPGMILSATTTVWLPVSRERLFDYLRNEQTRAQWDVLSLEGPMQQMLHIAKGQDLGNSISLLRSSANSSNSNQGSILILQETCNDVSGSLIVYAAVDIPAMNVVMGGGDSSCVVLLPSGFSIVSDCQNESTTNQDSSPGISATETPGSTGGGSGSLLTVSFQILVNSSSTRLTMDSVHTVNALITRTLQSIKAAFSGN
ncbi:OLC1v1027363C1 [Oldenlandia corymbosa var. corymbosa]|nr:OLC1v1027363C1 [Oldenlandia corymbosa var. corymbosa]